MLNTKMALSGAGPISEAVRETTQFALIKPKRTLRTGVDTSSGHAKDAAGKRADSKAKQ